MRKTAMFIGALLTALVAFPSLAGAQDTGNVTVVHGVPGESDFPVDIYVNGDITLEAFTFGEVAGPLELPAGDYDIEVYVAGADAGTDDPALQSTVTLPGGADATILANLGADGAPGLSVFVNDTSAIDAGNGRVTVRHTAAAPEVDVLAGGDVLFGDVPNGAEGVADVPAGTYPVQVVPAGATEPVVFETDLNVPEGSNVIVHAIGDLEGGTFAVAVQQIDNLQSAPAGVPTGTGGDAASGPSAWLLVVGAAAAVAAVVGGRKLLRNEA